MPDWNVVATVRGSFNETVAFDGRTGGQPPGEVRHAAG